MQNVLRLKHCSRTDSIGVRLGGWTFEGFFPRQGRDHDKALSDPVGVIVKRPMKREMTF